MKNENGFTLIEIIITSAIFFIVVLSMSLIFRSGINYYTNMKKHSDIIFELQSKLNNIIKDIQNSAAILRIDESNISLWVDDINRNNIIDESEIKEYQSDKENKISFFYNQHAPETTHIIIKLEKIYNNKHISVISSASIRNKING